MKKDIVLLLFLLVPNLAHSETRYVTDQSKIMMRTGETTSHKIVRRLPSGAAVEVISDNSKSGYSKIRTEDGLEGYVLTRQMLPEPVARERLAEVEAQLQALQQNPDKLGSQLASLQGQHEQLKQSYVKLKTSHGQLEQELATIKHTSANAVSIATERSELRKSVASLSREVEDLKQQNRDLQNNTAQNWFLIGAGVVIAGIILGLLLPHLRFQRRKSSWGSL